jgi:HlyD family secretion protein
MRQDIKRKVIFFIGAASICAIAAYRIFVADAEDLVLYGNVEIQDIDISFRVPGRVSKVLADEGSDVNEGSVLASLDADIFEAKMRTSKAQLAEAKTSLANAKKNYIRTLDLFKKKSIPEKIYDTAKTEYDVAQAKLDYAKAAYDIAMIELNDTELKAPSDGIVLTRNVERGEMISAGTPAFSIMPKKMAKIKTFANEIVLSKVKHGDIVYVNSESEQDHKYKGHIGYISSEAEFTPKNIETKEVRTSLMYRIGVILDEEAPSLKQGMPVIISYPR